MRVKLGDLAGLQGNSGMESNEGTELKVREFNLFVIF